MRLKTLSIGILLIFTFPLIGKAKIPEDILKSKCIIGIMCPDEIYQAIKDIAVWELTTMGFQFEYIYHINENPTLRNREFENFAKELESKNISYKYVINISHAYVSHSNSNIFSFCISNPNEQSLFCFKCCYAISSNSLETLLKRINKKLK